MTKAEREAMKARVKDLIKEGVEKELAKTIAKVEIEYKIIRPVVYHG